MNKAQFDLFNGALDAISALREELGWEPLPDKLREEWRFRMRQAEFANTNGQAIGGNDVEPTEN